jgi:PAS domain-containing protein
VNREDCAERIQLIDEYSQLITHFNQLLEALKGSAGERSEDLWSAATVARADSQGAWEALEKHIEAHKCIDLPMPAPDPVHVPGILGKAALAAIDLILVADDDRRFVEVNEAAADAFGLPRGEIVGRRIDDFFANPAGKTMPAAWSDFVARGVYSGPCETKVPGRSRKFDIRSKANFEPGLHLSVLREVSED